MCLSKVYLEKGGERELILEDVSSVKFEGDKILVNTLFGEQQELKAGISEIDLMKHIILLEKSVYELGYELNNRPDWVIIPIKGIRYVLEGH